MKLNEITTEEIRANRFNLETEYKTIKAFLLNKINRMEVIENEIKEIDVELKLRAQSKKS